MRKSLGILLALLLMLTFASQVGAERGRGRGRGRQTEQPAEKSIPTSDQIATAMEDVQWGWNHAKVISHFTGQLQKLYRPLLGKAPDAITEDRLRRDMDARINRIKNSYIEFTGQQTGWDTSLIRDEYTHGNSEALVEVREIRTEGADPRYTDYFFFINDHLWRRYRAFNQDQFEGIPFETAALSFQKRFGTAREKRRGSALVGLEWQDSVTRLEAIDNTEFFGVFCLVFSEKATESHLDTLRKNKVAKRSGLSPLVEALDGTEGSDRNADVVEHITGQRYNTAKNQEPVKGSSSGRDKTQPSKGPSSRNQLDEPERRPAKSSGDPLNDLEI